MCVSRYTPPKLDVNTALAGVSTPLFIDGGRTIRACQLLIAHVCHASCWSTAAFWFGQKPMKLDADPFAQMQELPFAGVPGSGMDVQVQA